MTPERREYLDNISRDEKTTRHFLEIYKNSIKHLKSYLNTSDYKDIKGAKNAIAETKAAIKMLKKQLPAPLLKMPICLGSEIYYFCSSCGIVLISDTDNYCCKCGQKLR